MSAPLSKATAPDPFEWARWTSPASGRTDRRTESIGYIPNLAVASSVGQLRVLGLIADLAERFISIEPDAIDGSVVDGLRQIAEALQLDQAILWRQDAGDASAVVSHSWIKHPQTSRPAVSQLASIPCIAGKLRAGEAAWFTRLDDVADPADREELRRHGLRTAAVIPVTLAGGARDAQAALAFCSTTTEHEWSAALLDQLRLLSGIMGQALAHEATWRALDHERGEHQRLREHMAPEGAHGRAPVSGARPVTATRLMVSKSATVRHAIAQVEQVAPTPSTVLLLGETGVGKDVCAQAIHDLSPRRLHPMVRVNCAAMPSTLIESELFGRERGAYTGALARQIGRFEAAHQSTLFLDEIGELSVELQVKLLRVLQERVIERLGSTQPIKVDVRIIAATNRNLEQAVDDGVFREDLFYRLNVFPIAVPPLRERVEDIPTLAWEFIREFSVSLGKPIESVSAESMQQLQRYSWPGNVRELRNVIERAVIIANGPQLTVPIPQPALGRQARSASTLRDLEVNHILATLKSTNWRVRGPGGAAERLGLKPTTLETRMVKLGVARPQQPSM